MQKSSLSPERKPRDYSNISNLINSKSRSSISVTNRNVPPQVSMLTLQTKLMKHSKSGQPSVTSKKGMENNYQIPAPIDTGSEDMITPTRQKTEAATET